MYFFPFKIYAYTINRITNLLVPKLVDTRRQMYGAAEVKKKKKHEMK